MSKLASFSDFKPGLLVLGLIGLALILGSPSFSRAAELDGTHLVFLPAVTGGARNGSQPPPGGSSTTFAYSDATVLPPQPLLQQQIAARKGELCQPAAAPLTLSRNQALQNGWRYLEEQIGAGNLALFRSTPEVATAEAAQAFAMAALADSRPDGALAGMLLAHELNPQSPLNLINAAGMLATLNMPNEALALLDAAESTPGLEATPLGIPAGQLAANTRGFALLARGEWAAAAAVLDPLVAEGTELAEARRNLSLALLCQDQEEEAARFYRVGARRMQWDVTQDGEEIEEIRLPPNQTLNRSAGKLFTLPPLSVTNNPAQAQALSDHLGDLNEASLARGAARQALLEANEEQRSARPLPNALSWSRFNMIYITATRTEYEPDIQALYQAAAQQEEAIGALQDRQDEEFLELFELYPEREAFVSACQATVKQQLAATMSAYLQFEALLADYTAAKYAAMTSVAAHLADPLNHEYVSLLIEDSMDTDVSWGLHVLWSQANRTAVHWATCEAAAESASPAASEPVFARSAQCPEALTRNKLSVTILELVQIKANCEVFEVEVSGEGLLTLFGQVTINLKDKSTTIFAGAKVKGPLGLAELGVNEGFFVTVGEGGVKDLGVKVSVSADVKAGQFAGSVDGPEFEFGVAPAVEYVGGFFAPN